MVKTGRPKFAKVTRERNRVPPHEPESDPQIKPETGECNSDLGAITPRQNATVIYQNVERSVLSAGAESQRILLVKYCVVSPASTASQSTKRPQCPPAQKKPAHRKAAPPRKVAFCIISPAEHLRPQRSALMNVKASGHRRKGAGARAPSAQCCAVRAAAAVEPRLYARVVPYRSRARTTPTSAANQRC